MALKTSVNLKDDEFIVLSYYGDMKPHTLFAQFHLIKMVYRKMTHKKFIKITRRFFMNGILTSYGDDYFKIRLSNRKHILTKKGDELLREASIYRGGDYNYYKNFARREAK